MSTRNNSRQLTGCLFFFLLVSGMTWGQSPTLSSDSFGFQCGISKSTNCPNEQWPMTQAQPGVFRLWDASVQWSAINRSKGVYDFSNLDSWLDVIAQHQPRAVIYTFGWTPCWDTENQNNCNGPNNGSPDPPSDLGTGCATGTGSPSFCNFVTMLVGYCSKKGNCVSKYIQYFELWNEANSTAFWTGSVGQLYQMMAPAVSIVRNSIINVSILTPPIQGGTGKSQFQPWACSWLGEEVTNGRLSNIYAFHTYLQNDIPENRWSLAAEEVAPNTQYQSTCGKTGWSALPWWLTETDYNSGSGFADPFVCDSQKYSPQDCAGQILRWQAFVNSNGGFNLSWYYWNTSIGGVSLNEQAYYWMMQYLVGGSFSQPCSPNNLVPTTWTCPFTEGGGTQALFVWTPTETGTITYTVPAGYVDYRDLSGGMIGVTAGEIIPITVEPIMLEGVKPPTDH